MPIDSRRSPAKTAAHALARSVAGGEFTPGAMESRCVALLGRRCKWLPGLLGRLYRQFQGATRPRLREIEAFVLEDDSFQKAWGPGKRPPHIEHFIATPAIMQPHKAARDWGVPPIETPRELAQWLSLRPAELDWFADVRKQSAARHIVALQHYRYRTLTKKPGGIRLIEAPKNRLKEMQKRILREILERVPAHSAAHGFVKGRNVQTFLQCHAGSKILLKLDLQNFFPSIGAARLQAFFRMIGYPDAVAELLTGLVTTTTARGVWKQLAGEGLGPIQIAEAKMLYGKPHLPQGAPTSPALANICAYRMDCRLSGLAEAAGGRYTRYADDLAFSGDGPFVISVERFALHAAAVIAEEGFAVHHRKTRVMRQGVRQHMAGLVVNERLNLMRPDFDRLKATLTNCIRTGPAAQNRERYADFRAHLEGRVAYAAQVNAAKSNKLRALFERINWE